MTRGCPIPRTLALPKSEENGPPSTSNSAATSSLMTLETQPQYSMQSQDTPHMESTFSTCFQKAMNLLLGLDQQQEPKSQPAQNSGTDKATAIVTKINGKQLDSSDPGAKYETSEPVTIIEVATAAAISAAKSKGMILVIGNPATHRFIVDVVRDGVTYYGITIFIQPMSVVGNLRGGE
jgi:hypothetical protein